jgi:diguanylate cyclase (GGDEF)-like protein
MSPTGTRSKGDEAASTRNTVVAVVGFLALAGFYLEVARIPSKGPAQIVIGDLGFFGLVACVTVLAALAVGRSKGTERRLWTLLTTTFVVLLASEAYWLFLVIAAGSPPPPVYLPFQVLHTVAALLFLSVVATLTPLFGANALLRARQLLDIASFGVVVYVIAFFLSVTPFFSGVRGSTAGDALVGAVYPTWGILMLAGLAWPTLASGRRYPHRPWEKLLAASLALYATAIAAWPLWFAWAMDISGSGQQAILDIMQMLSFYLLALALLWRLREKDERWTPPRTASSPPRPARVITYLVVGFVMVSMPVLIALAITSPEGSLTRVVLIATSALLALMTIARTVLTAIESGRLFRRSRTDSLTSLYNHRHFHESLRSALDVAARFGGCLSVLALDLDGFDEVNNRHGHPAGDDLLRVVGTVLRAACRPSDIMCRVGGDEFAAVLPGADAEQALEIAARIRRAMADVLAPDGVPITVSTGVACFPMHGDDADSLMRFADGAAYWVKRHGKDHALVYDPAVVTELSPDELVRAAEEQAESGIVRALAAAVDARHAHTSTHSVAVAAWSTDVARRLGLTSDRVRLIETAALLHDVGMIAVREDVIGKPSKLDAHEAEEVQAHARLGERIVAGTASESVLQIIRHHHERWDGTGYPDGLRAVEIPLEARILSVCGAYDAMTSTRPHRPAIDRKSSCRERVSIDV